MATYEHIFLARQDISSGQVDGLTDQFKTLIETGGGQVTKTEYWGLKTLSYRIKKNRKAHYVMFNIDAPAPAVQEMERQMRIHDDILRFLTVRVNDLEEGPSAMMQRGRDRDDRRGGPRRDRDDRGPRRDRDDRGPRGDRDRDDRGPRGDRDRDDRPPRRERESSNA